MAAHHGKATSFADPADVAAFKRCKSRGGTDKECFKVGDNAIGCWGDSTAEGSGPSCALPPDDMIEKWGNVKAAKHKRVIVTANGRTVTCTLKRVLRYFFGYGVPFSKTSLAHMGEWAHWRWDIRSQTWIPTNCPPIR